MKTILTTGTIGKNPPSRIALYIQTGRYNADLVQPKPKAKADRVAF
jgi:hypothetical protein